MSGYVLETERLGLREMRQSDVPHLREMIADEYARRIFERIVAIPDYEQRWLERNLDRYRELGFGLWAVETKADGAFVGDCGLTWKQIGDDRLLEVGYHVTAAARGRGYATEAAAACLRYGFEELGAERIVSIVDVRNPASRKVAERIHARYEEGLEYFGRSAYLFSTERTDL